MLELRFNARLEGLKKGMADDDAGNIYCSFSSMPPRTLVYSLPGSKGSAEVDTPPPPTASTGAIIFFLDHSVSLNPI